MKTEVTESTTTIEPPPAAASKPSAPQSRLPAPGSRLPPPGSRIPPPGSRLPAPGSKIPSAGAAAVRSGIPAPPGSRLPSAPSRIGKPMVSKLAPPGSLLKKTTKTTTSTTSPAYPGIADLSAASLPYLTPPVPTVPLESEISDLQKSAIDRQLDEFDKRIAALESQDAATIAEQQYKSLQSEEPAKIQPPPGVPLDSIALEKKKKVGKPVSKMKAPSVSTLRKPTASKLKPPKQIKQGTSAAQPIINEANQTIQKLDELYTKCKHGT